MKMFYLIFLSMMNSNLGLLEIMILQFQLKVNLVQLFFLLKIINMIVMKSILILPLSIHLILLDIL